MSKDHLEQIMVNVFDFHNYMNVNFQPAFPIAYKIYIWCIYYVHCQLVLPTSGFCTVLNPTVA